MPAQVLERMQRQGSSESADDDSSDPASHASPPLAAAEEAELRRPKVGAEMPVGRPSWFHVPAPSQGASASLQLFLRGRFF
jgi:hypothetical protein